MTAGSAERTRILIVGGGYVGMYTALRLQRRLRSELKAKKVEIIVVDPRSYMTYQPFLPEAAAGSVEPRHVVVPLRRVLDKCEVLTGAVRLARPRAPGRAHPADPRRGLRAVLRGRRAGARLDRAHPADPRPGRAGHRLQAGRGGHRAAQPGARQARHRHERHRPRRRAAGCSPSCSSAAATPASRRWPSWRTWPATRPATTRTCPRATSGSCSSRRPAGSCPRSARTWGATPSSELRQARRSTSGSTPGSSRASTATSCSPTARSSTPRPSSGPRASRPTRCSRRPACRWTTRAGCAAARTCGSRASTAPGRRVTARRCPT